jgi:hypothetical protein
MNSLRVISRARPGTSVDVLCIVLGVDGPHAFETSDGGKSVYARVQLADESSPDGMPLLFFGTSAHRVLSIRPLLPTYFSQIAVKQPDRYGVVSFVWCAGRSSVNRNPSRTHDCDALEEWSIAHLGPLVRAARDGYLRARGDVRKVVAFHPTGRAVPTRDFQREAVTRQTEMEGRDPMDLNPNAPHHAAMSTADRTKGHAQKNSMRGGHAREAANAPTVARFSAVAAAERPCLMRIRIVGAKFPANRTRKRTRSGQVLTAELIQSLVQGGCQEECTTSASFACPELHLAGCRRAIYNSFWLHAADARGKRLLVLVNNSAAERVMLGVRAGDARRCRASAARAVEAIHALVREQGPFYAMLRVRRRTASGLDAPSPDMPCALELLQLFV